MQHLDKKNTFLLLETAIIYIALGAFAYFSFTVQTPFRYLIYAPILFFQGLWFYRLYIIGHEASHRKLFTNRKLNFLMGSLVLVPLLVPFPIFQKIHAYHHGYNRRDPHTSALDTYVVKGSASTVQKIYYFILWYIAVFFGGFFLHSLVSVVLFLFMPISISKKISPAFRGWTYKKQFQSILLFAMGVVIHYAFYTFIGKDLYFYFILYPMLSFAWILSLVVYIFHFHATIGHEVRLNARSLRAPKWIMWTLLNFTEHAKHHHSPKISWFDLPKQSIDFPTEFVEKNEHYQSVFKAILNQFKGPIIHEEHT